MNLTRAKLSGICLTFLLLLIVAANFNLLLVVIISVVFGFSCLARVWQTQGLYLSRQHEAEALISEKKLDSLKSQEVLEEKNQTLEDSKRAILNILEDTQSLEQILQQERDRLQAVLLAMADGVLVFSPDLHLVMANAAAFKMLEIKPQAAVGKKIEKLFTIYRKKLMLPTEQWPSSQTLAQKKALQFEMDADLYLRCNTGKIFPISVSTALLNQDGKTWGLIMVLRDIAYDKNLDEAKANFISTASHQLRTPLTSMRWFGEMLLSGDLGKINKEQKPILEEILNSTTRMISLVAMLLQIARIEAGTQKTNPQPLDIKKMTESVLENFKGTVTENGQTVKFISSKTLPVVVLDQVLVWQVMQNLISNALKYSPKKSTVAVSIQIEDNAILWSVKDAGIGIPKEQQGRIFEKFFRADNAVNFAPEGSGLGLPLVKNLVEEWGGRIWFESEEKLGTTFYFTMPLTKKS